MNFNSINFLLFFPIVVLFYFIIPHKKRWIWLLISSYYFYMSWIPQYAVLMITTTIITYLAGLFIEKVNKIEDKDKSIKLKKIGVFISFASNLGILFLFKYFNFFRANTIKLFSFMHITINIPTFHYLLPIGISFYTFKALSYIMDIYRKDVEAEKNLGKYALYIAFFPQLAAGPIDKSKDFLHQFNEEHSFDYDRVKNGLLLMLWGYFQKMFISDRLANLVNTVYNDPQKYKGFEIIVATIFFAFQIYCDFSSYSDISIGASEVMGFNSTKNFRQPYLTKSIKEFWRCWHISLTSWFKDYLYIPIGGNRRGKLRTYVNIMIVFLVSGLWHGAAANFIIWGGLHGAYQVIGNLLKPYREKVIKVFKINTNAFSYKLWQVLFTFTLVDFAWIFFKASTFSAAVTLIKNMFYFNPWIFVDNSIYKLGLDEKEFTLAVVGIIVVLIVNMLQRTRGLRVEFSKQNTIFRWSLYIIAVMTIIIFGIYGPGYNVEQFIYFQF